MIIKKICSYIEFSGFITKDVVQCSIVVLAVTSIASKIKYCVIKEDRGKNPVGI